MRTGLLLSCACVTLACAGATLPSVDLEPVAAPTTRKPRWQPPPARHCDRLDQLAWSVEARLAVGWSSEAEAGWFELIDWVALERLRVVTGEVELRSRRPYALAPEVRGDDELPSCGTPRFDRAWIRSWRPFGHELRGVAIAADGDRIALASAGPFPGQSSLRVFELADGLLLHATRREAGALDPPPVEWLRPGLVWWGGELLESRESTWPGAFSGRTHALDQPLQAGLGGACDCSVGVAGLSGDRRWLAVIDDATLLVHDLERMRTRVEPMDRGELVGVAVHDDGAVTLLFEGRLRWPDGTVEPYEGPTGLITALPGPSRRVAIGASMSIELVSQEQGHEATLWAEAPITRLEPIPGTDALIVGDLAGLSLHRLDDTGKLRIWSCPTGDEPLAERPRWSDRTDRGLVAAWFEHGEVCRIHAASRIHTDVVWTPDELGAAQVGEDDRLVRDFLAGRRCWQ